MGERPEGGPAGAALHHLIIGTAGHIDHGKSSLVRALTGVDPDRLKEEQERGMTIDLGFAPLETRDGRTAGIIDVPGHERFVKNMVAGATSIDVALLVVAADDGVMPQTREHVEIMQILGIRRGLVALNKVDMAEPDLVELVEEDLRGFLEGSFLEGAPILRVSALTGQGLAELRSALEAALEAATPRDAGGVFRMPIQRVFSARGHGTVVTGVPLSGSIEVGQTVEVLPGGGRGRVRGIQAYRHGAAMARAGHSTALNCADLDYKVVQRGMVACEPGALEPASLLEVRLSCLGGGRRPLEHLETVRFHAGTVEALGELALLEGPRTVPGQTVYAQLRLREPTVVAPGDRFVLRLHSPMLTVGGGVVLGVSRHRLKRDRPRVLERLRRRLAALQDRRALVECAVEGAAPAAATEEGVRRELAMDAAELGTHLAALEAEGRVLRLVRPLRLHARAALEDLQRALARELAAFHEEHPLRLWAERSALAARLRADPDLVGRAAEALRSAGALDCEGDRLREAGRAPRLTPAQQALSDRLVALYLETGFITPRLEELGERLSVPQEGAAALVEMLLEAGTLVRLKDGVLLHAARLEEARARVAEEVARRGEVSAADFKDALGSTRKYVIPILEHLDEVGYTERRGNVRVLREASRRAQSM
ncbi:MAG: selenocysteine-specific translation elongation factor [Planctomycetes bacterium]|nr:selenocysteine-specific translation elongation factor [Planctomycetota bacterium]